MTKLSKRLTAIANLVTHGDVVADIGSDHALLPVYLVKNGIAPRAIAGELNAGPFEAANLQVRAAGLHDRIDVRRGNGLSVLEPGEADTITIAGMGGGLIVDILEQGLDRLAGVRSLILQPNVAEDAVRRWLAEHDYMLLDEQILTEDGVTYTILYAEHMELAAKTLVAKADAELAETSENPAQAESRAHTESSAQAEHRAHAEPSAQADRGAHAETTDHEARAIFAKGVTSKTRIRREMSPSSLYASRRLSCGLELDAAMLFRFGPYLVERMEPAFITKWQDELKKLKRIRQQITAKAGSDDAVERLRELDRDIAQIEEVLRCSRQELM